MGYDALRRAPTRHGHLVYLLGPAVWQMGGIDMAILRQLTEVNLKITRSERKVRDLRRATARGPSRATHSRAARLGGRRSPARAAVRSKQLPR